MVGDSSLMRYDQACEIRQPSAGQADTRARRGKFYAIRAMMSGTVGYGGRKTKENEIPDF
jgi:hypothetical protein